MAKPNAGEATQVLPDRRKLTKIQAARLGRLADIDAKDLVGATVADLSERFKFIDPSLLFFRKVCGKVVKKDPVTGIEYPVPFATVYVEDTDCNLITYFPPGSLWGWIFPLLCRRELIATTTTDRCGNFCVWIPRFEIDWILHWRRLRICFPEIFRRPSIRDLIPELVEPPVVRPHGPGPDPGPFVRLATLPQETIEALGGSAAREVAHRLQRIHAARTFGAPAPAIDELLDARAFDVDIPPPLPHEFRAVLGGRADVAEKQAVPHDAIRTSVARELGLSPRELEQFNIHHYYGPFWRCVDIVVPVWQRIVDVPDITFRVGQDTNGDGVEETIYSEGFFDVRWDAGPLPNVKLVASSIAKESHLCDTPSVPCGNVPALLFAGLMPLTDPNYFDSSEGYATRPNRPKPVRTAAKTPFLQTIQLYGCVNLPGASFYRVMQSIDGGTTFTPIVGQSWNIYPIPFGAPVTVTGDSAGWYAVLPNPDNFHPARMVLEWPTPAIGQYVLKIEIGDNAKSVISSSATVAIQVDNTAPVTIFNTLAWKFSSEPDVAFGLPGRDLLVPCPTIRRGASPQDIEVQFTASVSAAHLRDAGLSSSGCGAASAFQLLTSPPPTVDHWHTDPTDNSVVLSGRYFLSHLASEGAYSFRCSATSRAMNPSGGDGGHLADWFYDPIYVAANPTVSVAIVNA